MANPVLAGAIFTGDEIKVLVAVFIGVLIVGLAAILFFLRSCYRLATQEEKSSSDIVIVGVGLLLLLPPTISLAQGTIERAQRGGHEETAMQLISRVTNRTADEFDTGRWNDFHECAFYKVDISGLPRASSDSEQLQLNNRTIQQEADLFERSGWEVTRYASAGTGSSLGIAFRADLNEHAITLYDWGGLGYGYLDSDCPARSGTIQSGRFEVTEFTADAGR